ncbi:MAG: hypothetical protein K2L59_05100 [Muribaculaceae bacterium]|nr:hypothetical protein [Muribaculaceae bacterium]
MNIKNISVVVLLATAGALTGASETVDPLSAPTGKTDWIDPVEAVAVNSHYVLYPSPTRGEDLMASCMVYLPDCYDQDGDRRFPVIYYLHGGTGNQREGRWLVRRVHEATGKGEMEPVIIVCPQALPIGWYINANQSDPKVLSGPLEDLILKDLIPYIDSRYRTIPTAGGRGVEGFSMGGRGALAFAFGHPDVFGAVSSVAGAVVDWNEEPLLRALECTFGDADDPFSRRYFDSWHPVGAACRNSRSVISSGMDVRMYVGDQDRLYDENGVSITGRFHECLDRLSIPHSYTIVPGAGHDPEEIFNDSVNRYDTSFWDNAFAPALRVMEAPAGIREFLSSVFPGAEICDVNVIPDERGDHYDAILSDGSRVRFNEHLNWIKAETHPALFPDALLHEGIRGWMNENPGVAPVVSVEKVPRVGYDVRLYDGSSFLFDTAGRPIRE